MVSVVFHLKTIHADKITPGADFTNKQGKPYLEV